jgi:multidrug efflux pump subunit AcrB
MINIARFSIERPLYTWMLMLTCMIGGWIGINTVGRLEDPAFPIKMAMVVTIYPGASAAEVEAEVTDVIEARLQELPYVKDLESRSVAGRSEVQVELKEVYDDQDTPQIFDELRRRVGEAAFQFPPGVHPPLVKDDFGDVFGILYAIAAPGYTAADIQDISRTLVTQLKRVPGVAKVQTAGEPEEAIYVEMEASRFSGLGMPVDQLFQAIAQENQVTASGSVAFDGRRLRLAPQMAFDSVRAVSDMRIGPPGSTGIIRLGDIARITREPVETPFHLIRHQGESVFTVGVSVAAGENVVAVGQAVDDQMRRVVNNLPLGVEVHTIYAQHEVVEVAIARFLRNLGLSVGTVVLALCLFMGWRAGTIVGATLLLTVLGTIGLMSVFGISLQRISLGALMISMGMLVDNGIVIAEGMVIGVRKGRTPAQAAEESVMRTQFPLLGATVIGVIAFGPISLADDNSGHFLRALFQVVALALLLSWILAVTVVPLLGSYLLRSGEAEEEAHIHSGWGYAPYRWLLDFGLRRAWLTTGLIVMVTSGCIWSFQFVKQGFFPVTGTPLLYVDYRLPQGSDILTTQADVIELERTFRSFEGVVAVSSFIGRGASRFASINQPEQPDPAYAQMVIRVRDVEVLEKLLGDVATYLDQHYPHVEVTPSGSSKIEARFTGPDAKVLRSLAEQALAKFLSHDLVDRKTDWRDPSLLLVPVFDEAGARLAGISRRDIAQTLAFTTEGVRVGLYRDADKMVPIIARAPEHERRDLAGLPNRLVWSPTQQRQVPMSQVVSAFNLVSVDENIFRLNRVRTITAQANPPRDHNATATFNRIRASVEEIPLPIGYQLEWGGEFEASKEANTVIFEKIPLAFLFMLLMTILMFGRLRQPLVIWATVPMTVCGVVIGLLATNLAFTFPSFLGLLSLSGMLIKNCIILVDEIDKRMVNSGVSLATITVASVSRLRPVVLAAGTTIAGMSPLLADPFFLEMAVCIMSGLAFATLLTLIAVPVFYRLALSREIDRSTASQGSS